MAEASILASIYERILNYVHLMIKTLGAFLTQVQRQKTVEEFIPDTSLAALINMFSFI